jgi:hypothetical protein
MQIAGLQEDLAQRILLEVERGLATGRASLGTLTWTVVGGGRRCPAYGAANALTHPKNSMGAREVKHPGQRKLAAGVAGARS